ncbi:MAG: zinc-binding dehydrogenase [Promethearchaeota archaeon]
MKQQVLVAPKKIEFRDVPIPKMNKNDVLVKIVRIGICGSDIHVYHGKHPLTSYPVTQGHEVSGIIEKAGSQVEDYKPGEMVTIQPQVVCGKCFSCTHGNYHICDELKVMGFQTTGMASEYFVVEKTKIIKLPKSMSYDEGAMIEPTAVACAALSKTDSIEGSRVIVLGAGPIGNLVAQTSKALGAKEVLITDLSDYRLEIAKTVGIDYPINPQNYSLSEKINELFGPDKADLIVECVGSNLTINEAISNARKGTSIIIVGVFSDNQTIDLASVQNNELQLIGSLMYQKKNYLQAIDLVKKNRIQLKPLMTTHFPFHEYNNAYQYIERKKDKIMKVFIVID